MGTKTATPRQEIYLSFQKRCSPEKFLEKKP